MKRRALGVVVLFVAVLLASAPAALGQTTGTGGLQPYVMFGMVTPGQTTATASVGDDLKAGTPVEALFAAKNSLCQSSFGGPKTPSDDARTVVKLSAELLEQKGGAYSVRLASRHLRTDGRATDQVFTQTVSMRDGDRVTLDMLRESAPAEGCNWSTVTLEAKLLVKPDPTTRAVYVADVWFVHRDGTGREWNQHMTANVGATADTPLLFNDITFPLPKLDPNQDQFDAFVRLGGTLRARPQGDGLVQLDVTTQRSVGIVLPSNIPGTFGSSPHVTLTVRPDETAAIEIPQPGSGFVMTALRIGGKISGSGSIGARPLAPGEADPMASRPGVFINKDAFVLNTGVYFKGHVTRLLIRVHKAQEEANPGPPTR